MKSHEAELLKRLDRGKNGIVSCCQEPECLLLVFAFVIGKGWPPSSFLRQTWHSHLSDSVFFWIDSSLGLSEGKKKPLTPAVWWRKLSSLPLLLVWILYSSEENRADSEDMFGTVECREARKNRGCIVCLGFRLWACLREARLATE